MVQIPDINPKIFIKVFRVSILINNFDPMWSLIFSPEIRYPAFTGYSVTPNYDITA